MTSTKIELNYNKIARIQALDEIAIILFPGNENHQRIFLHIFTELKYAKGELLSSLEPLCEKYGFSHRILETVRSKMRRMGIIDHVSRFNKNYGYREGWVFSNRFGGALMKLADVLSQYRKISEGRKEKEFDCLRYL